MAVSHADPRVDEYIIGLPIWQQEICYQVRAIIHAADPEITETIKRSKQPYFVLEGNIAAILAAKDHVNVFIYDPMVPDPESIINQGLGNKTARAIQFYQGELINEQAFLRLVKLIVSRNRKGGWRRLLSENVSS